MKKHVLVSSITALGALLTQPAFSEESRCTQSLDAAFIEGAPRDNFTFANTSKDSWQVKKISIDLTGSSGKLIFDTNEGGDGVEVFQLYKTESGTATLAQVTQPDDGSKTMQLEFLEFTNQQSFRFSIDVDDTVKQSSLGQIRVTGGELKGAELIVTFENTEQTSLEAVVVKGTYTDDNTAQLMNGDC